jgi:penicillin-binding protein 1C
MQAGWQYFYSSPLVAWKTGTSHGNRDAWAIGISPEYTVGVWSGNADGEGRPKLTGVSASAPILFHVFELLQPKQWFQKPQDMKRIEVCKVSGYKASEICPKTKFMEAPPSGDKTPVCPYHKVIHLDQKKQYRVNRDCVSPEEIVTEIRFVLPTLMEKYYKTRNPFYEVLPPYRKDCGSPAEDVLELIYPENNTNIFLPRDLASSKKNVVFKAAHRQSDITLFWFMDESFIQITEGFHEISVNPKPGEHSLTVTDENGNSINRHFTVIGKEK